MAKVFIHVTMSLDGFIARPDGSVDWGFHYGSDEMVSNSINEIGAIVAGNRGFWEAQASANDAALPYGGIDKVPVYVVTHAPREPIVIGGMPFHFICNIQEAVELAKHGAGEKNVALVGASIDQQCLSAGLVNEILIHLAPVLLGEGIRLFEHVTGVPIELERIGVAASAGIISLRFKVLK
jgi:dihydrofolate reductase